MHDVMRKRLWRKLEALPDEQLYQVLDYIEFLEARYAREAGRQPDGLQRLAERFEDRMRARSVAPMAIGGTMRLIGTAGRMIDGLSDIGKELIEPLVPAHPAAAKLARRDVDSAGVAAGAPARTAPAGPAAADAAARSPSPDPGGTSA